MTDPTPLQQSDVGEVPPPLPFLKRLQPLTFSLLALVVIFFLYQVVAGAITLVLSSGRITRENVDLIRWGTLLGQLLCILVPTLVLTRLRHGNIRSFLKLRVPDYKEVLLTVTAVFALQQVLQGYMMLQDAIPLPPTVRHYVDVFKTMFEETYRTLVTARTPLEFVGVIITVALVPAVSEELLFRGLVQGNIETAAGGLRAAVITGLIFGAYHLNPFSVVPLMALGVYFGYIVYRSQNVMVAVSAHFFNNFVACAATYMQLDDDFVALSPSGPPAPTLVLANVMFFLMIFAAASYLFHRITDSEPVNHRE